MNASEIPNPIPNFPEFGHISLSGLHNARDLGGMPCEDDWVITPARLIRSDALHHATKEDFDTLTHDHELSRVIDLRSDLERNALIQILSTSLSTSTFTSFPFLKERHSVSPMAAKTLKTTCAPSSISTRIPLKSSAHSILKPCCLIKARTCIELS